MQHLMLGTADDEVFGAFRPAGMVTESAHSERSDTDMDNLITEAAEGALRGEAMGAVLSWVEDGDWSFEALDSVLEGMASDSDDDDLTDDEQEHYDAIWETVAEALESLGAESASIDSLYEEDDDAAQALGKFLASALDEVTKDDDDLVSEFAVGGQLVLEATRRVVRGGKSKRVRKRRKKKRRRTASQRASLKKARRKSHNSGARRSRKKSMRRRKSMGM